MKITDNTILITGGSAGIGLAMATALIAAKNTVIVCGRDRERLEQVQEVFPGIHTIQCDVSRDEELANLASRVQRDFPHLNMLINNAGVMHIGDFFGNVGTPKSIEEEVQTNLLAPMKLTSLLLPVLLQQADAAIVIVSSGLAYVPVANVAVYCATKAALHSFSHSLRYQLKSSVVKVFELLPPLVNTELVRSLTMPKVSAEQVVKELLKGLEKERYEVRVGMVQFLHTASHLVPLFTERMLNKAFSR